MHSNEVPAMKIYLRFLLLWLVLFVDVAKPKSNTWTWNTDSERLSQVNIPKNEVDKNIIDIYLSNNNHLTYIDPNTFTDFTMLRKLVMERNSLYNFPSDKPFLRQTKLEIYHCIKCGITHVYNRTFIELGALHTLVLSENKIEYISPYAFRNNSKLNYLDLQSNLLKYFNDQSYLHQMYNIGYLFLSGNNEFNFRDNRTLTGRIDTLKVFKCDGCAIVDACLILKSYPKIMELQLKDNQITSFNCPEPKHAIDINLSGNPIKSLKVSGKKLTYFNCTGCGIEEIDDRTFNDAGNLQSVDLSSNNIKLMTSNAFSQNKMLEDLRLESNRIRNFSQTFLDSMPSLKKLCIDGNNFCPSYDNTLFKKMYVNRKLRNTCDTKLPFEKFLKDIKSRNSTVFCDRRPKLTRSTSNSLDLSGQDIEFLVSDYLYNTDDVKFLNISHNPELTFDESQVFLQHSFLEEIDISYCGIEKIYKNTFSELPKMLKIDLSYNRITEIVVGSFSNNHELEDLILDGNLIGSIPSDVFNSVEKLTRLSMSYNADFDFEISEVFLTHPGLQEFLCEHCGITGISVATLSHMTNLRKLILSFNKIEEIESLAFDQNKHLNYINLDGNQLKSFDVNLVNQLAELAHLCLDKNEAFDYSESKANKLLREFYVARNLRTPFCAAENDKEFVENRLPKPVQNAEIFHPKDMHNRMSAMNAVAEPEKAESDGDGNLYDDYYEDKPTEIDTFSNETSKDDEEEEEKIIKRGSFGGNSGFALKGHLLGIMSALFIIYGIQ